MRKTNHILLTFLPIILASAGTGKEPLTITASAKEGKAFIKIDGYISGWGKNSAVDLGVKIDELITAGHSDATVYINTRGGSTIEAAEIYNTIRKLPGKIHGTAGALVGSAGTWLACKFDTFEVRSNTQYMWHRPFLSLDGNVDEIRAGLKLGDNTEKDYLAVYAAKTGKTVEELEALWKKGDQWLMGQEIVDFGFADTVLKEPSAISIQDVSILSEIGAPVIPKATAKSKQSNSQNKKDMEINPLLIGLKADATKAEIEARLIELSKKETEADTLAKEKVDAEALAKVKDIEAVLTTAISEKKITAEQKDSYKKVLEADFDNGKTIIEGIVAVTKITGAVVKETPDSKDRKDWTFADWQIKDPEGLSKMHESDEAKFDKLFEAK